MEPDLAEQRLRELLGDRLEPRLDALSAEFGGLLDRDALVLLAADEEGLLPVQASLDTSGADGPPPPLDVAGTVERLTATRPFRRADGSTGFVCDVALGTPAGEVRVVLWDEAVRAIQGTQGRRVRLTGLAARVRAGARELHSTRDTEVRAL